MKEDIHETRFDNGLVLLTDTMPGVRSATLGFFFRVGARHEPAELHGMSHFIEHAVFKGTARRSALDIAIEQDRLGGNLDAFTTHEETGFAIKVVDDQLESAFDLIADMLVHPSFDETELKAEQRVIIEEMKMIDDSPEEYLGEIFSEAFFPSHPLGMSIAGTKSSVKGFDRAKTEAYHRGVFVPGNLVIAAAGNVRHENLLQMLGTAGLDSSPGKRSVASITPPTAAASFTVKTRPDLEQAHLIIATPFVSATDQRRYAADLLTNILGGGTSSRLWQSIREQRGLAYSVGCSSGMYLDCGVFSVFAGTSPTQVKEVVTLALAEMKSIIDHGVTEAELDLAKAQSRASILLSLEDSASRAAVLAQSEMVYGRQISVEETLSQIAAVTLEDCRSIASEFWTPANLAFAAVGDLKQEKLDRSLLTFQ